MRTAHLQAALKASRLMRGISPEEALLEDQMPPYLYPTLSESEEALSKQRSEVIRLLVLEEERLGKPVGCMIWEPGIEIPKFPHVRASRPRNKKSLSPTK